LKRKSKLSKNEMEEEMKKDNISNIYISFEKNEELYSKLVCVRGLIKNMNNFKL